MSAGCQMVNICVSVLSTRIMKCICVRTTVLHMTGK